MAASIVLGLAGGAIAGFADARGWLKNQARFAPKPTLDLPMLQPASSPDKPQVTAKMIAKEAFDMSWKLVLMFFGFSFIGYLLNGLIPQEWIKNIFGTGNAFSVPIAAILGIPFYLNTEASLPLVRAFLDSGMSQGTALAFLITGAGTSIGALGGALTIARWRVVGIVLGTLVTGAIAIGFAYDLVVPFLV
jgi:hypothetical protein